MAKGITSVALAACLVLAQGMPLSVAVKVEPSEVVTYYDVPLSRELQDHLFAVCEEYAAPAELVLAIISVESEYDWQAKSSTGDYGLMQINECNLGWLRDLGMTNVFNPRQNISAGVHILSMYWSDDLCETLMRYNCGVAGAERLRAKGVTETAYTRKVLAEYEKLKEAGKCTQ